MKVLEVLSSDTFKILNFEVFSSFCPLFVTKDFIFLTSPSGIFLVYFKVCFFDPITNIVFMKTIFVIGSKKHTLKYTRKMPEGEVKKMKSFVTNKGQKLEKTSKFKILKVSDDKTSRTFKISL